MKRTRWLAPLVLGPWVAALAQTGSEYVPAVPAPGESEDPVPITMEAARSLRQLTTTMPTTGLRIDVSRTRQPKALRSTGEYIGFVRINPLFLARPVELKVDPGQPLMAFGLPVELARLDLTLEGKQYELFFADDVSEKRLGLRHVTMSVMNDVESHARFSINASGEVYGTLKTPDATYVFEPSDVAGEQLVYRYGSFDKSSASRGIERSLIGKSALARRHHQLDALADIRPITARTDENRAFIRGGELGSILRSSPQEFKRIAAHLSAITNLRGNEQFEVVAETSTFDGGKIVSFRQTLDGIQVDAHNEIVVDGHGKVLELSTHVVPTDIARQKALISL